VLIISCKLSLFISSESINRTWVNMLQHSWKNLSMSQFSAKSFYYNGTAKTFALIKSVKFTIKKPKRNSVILSKISWNGWKKLKREAVDQKKMRRRSKNQQILKPSRPKKKLRKMLRKKKLKNLKLKFELKKNKRKWLKNKEKLKLMPLWKRKRNKKRRKQRKMLLLA